MKVQSLICILTAAVTVGSLSPSLAQAAYPERPVKIIVPYAPGGLTDGAARLMAQELQAQLKQPFVVENRPGAVGLLAHREVLQAKNDGYTLLVSGSGPLSIMPFTRLNLGYDPYHAFTPIKLISSSPLVLVTNLDRVKATTVADLVAENKAKQASGTKMSYGSFGEGSPAHLAAESFKSLTGVQATHVPFKGGTEAFTNLLGGHIDMLFDTVFVALPHIEAGKVRALAVTTAERLPMLPNTPTLTEVGVPMVMTTWNAMVGPAGLPREVVDTLSRVMDQALAKKDVQDKLLAQGGFAEGGTPEKCGEFISNQLTKMQGITKAAGIVPQ